MVERSAESSRADIPSKPSATDEGDDGSLSKLRGFDSNPQGELGPRFWQAPWWYRWLTGNFGERDGFVVSIVTRRNGDQMVGGVWLEDGEYQPLERVTIDTDWRSDDYYPEHIRAHVATASAEHVIEGRVLSLIPLRNRRTSPEGEQLLTRISEGMTEWRSDGRVGFGLSEYLDQIVDGQPVGVAA